DKEEVQRKRQKLMP
nr:Chain B, Nuclear factor NF-kappa-B p105 subunit [Homo sapiens]7LET_B Chain B, Nuclear factor NF-kappa-B p105 subunit [Homo sapiens]7LF4_B Chain B, Nuclear factor NF-kappa-B p105 subunit [Homo sapiens]7LF4_F Chain F, Nuclear factor NF-kappa-B p105 subunit [Homo sapiens]7LFC_B Chain B, Nuclear factor NF-kappa-B p105 subunit [Homo sapiens]